MTMDTLEANAIARIADTLGPGRRDDDRRASLLAQSVLNGIDFVEFETVFGVPQLEVHFLHPLPAGTYGLQADASPVLVHGGTRINGVAVTGVTWNSALPQVLVVSVDLQGDYSPYWLSIGWLRGDDGAWHYDFPALDRPFSIAPVNFRPGCPVDADCAPAACCPPEPEQDPRLDYMARDYASFRQMLLDLVAQRNPAWTERSAADLGIALLELFAYEADHISYFQDAVANEAYLDTARQRVSAKRHAKLLDYHMHDGRNTWTWVHFQVTSAGDLSPGQPLLTRIPSALRPEPTASGAVSAVAPPGAELRPLSDADYRSDPALAQVRVFETATAVRTDPRHNELRIHSWGNRRYGLPRGATTAHVYAVDASGKNAVRPSLAVGDFLLLEEVLGAETGAAADADPAHRQVVCIERLDPDTTSAMATPPANALNDPLFQAALDPVTGQPLPALGSAAALPLVEVTWRRADALLFPLCVAEVLADGRAITRAAVARGNIALADHGRSVQYDYLEDAAASGPDVFPVRLQYGPLTMQRESGAWNGGFPPVHSRPDLSGDVHDMCPAVMVRTSTRGVQRLWRAMPDLLSSDESDRHFVADVDGEGRATLRFGDGEYGERLGDVDALDVWYRIGNGRSGNIGADALSHIVRPRLMPPDWPDIAMVRNPLPASTGVDPETIEEVRQYAPAAFRATPLRAVTEQDYQQAALRLDGVAGAVASFRWTGSWTTVFVGIDPVDPGNVLTNGRGFTRLTDEFRNKVQAHLDRYRLAGYDLEIRSASYVPLEIALHLCAKAGYFAADVARAVALALGAGTRCNNAGLFDPSQWTFGQAVYLSRIYAVVKQVEGVESVTVTTFRRRGRTDAGELDSGVLPIGPWEIARLDNDRGNLENGTLIITAGGGK